MEMVSGDDIIVGFTLIAAVVCFILVIWLSLREREFPGYFNTDLTEDEKKALDEARERLPDRTWDLEVPELGHPLYGGKTYPKFTIHLYKEGVVAPFVFNGSSKRRFVPYERITGVYPVGYKSPSKTRLVPALQIETSDYATFIVRSWYYDLSRVKALLSRGIGSRWEDVYHPDKTLHGEMYSIRHSFVVTDDLLKHEAVRTGGPLLT